MSDNTGPVRVELDAVRLTDVQARLLREAEANGGTLHDFGLMLHERKALASLVRSDLMQRGGFDGETYWLTARGRSIAREHGKETQP